MTKREREQLEKAISHLMSDDEPDGFTSGMDILLTMAGKKHHPEEGQVNSIWELKIVKQAPGAAPGEGLG